MTHNYPKKSLGQNFLINRGVLEKIISAAELSPDDTVLEIGPGEGILTEALAGKAGRIVAVEKDRRLIDALQGRFSAYKNIEIIEGDILEYDITRLGLSGSDYKIVANIPYYITSHLLRTIFSEWPKPLSVILMVQKEVAKRICAKTGEHSILSLSVQFYAEPEVVDYVSRGSFRPMPKVDSAILKLAPRTDTPDKMFTDLFFRLIKAGFASPRKKLISNLTAVFPGKKDVFISFLSGEGFAEGVRAEKIPLAGWLKLAEILST